MIFNNEELNNVKLVPSKVQRLFVDSLANGDSDLTVLDPTNPFTMLLEATVVTANNAMEESHSVARRLYPSLANNKEDLYHHISTIEEKNLFSTPAEVGITFYINKLDIIGSGINPELNNGNGNTIDDGTRKVTIPKFTEVSVGDLVLTTLNDIDITVKDNRSFVEQKSESEQIAINSIGNLFSSISMDAENTEWVVFETKMAQIKRESYEFQVIKNNPFKQVIPYTDNYSYSEVYIKDNNNNWIPMEITHSTIVFDHNLPTIKVVIGNNGIEYSIPDFYIVDGDLSGLIRIDMFTTKGKVLLPLSKFNIADFSIKLPDKVFTEESAVMVKVDKLANSKKILDGGVTSVKTRDLRNKIIYNTTGVIDLPITEKQLNEHIKTRGFTLYKAIDTITERTFIAGKNINDVYKLNKLGSNIDIFNNTIDLLPGEVDNDSVDIRGDVVLIKSGTIFKSINGVTKIISRTEEDALRNTVNIARKKLLYSGEYYTTPFYYMLDLNGDVLNSRIYDLDNPSMSNMSILNKNKFFEHNVNISKYFIHKVPTGYQIILSLFGNDKFAEIDKDKVFIQATMDANELGNEVHFTGEYNAVLDKYVINIDTNLFVDILNRVYVTNGLSNIYTNKVYIDGDIRFIVYTTEPSLLRDDRYEPTLEVFNQHLMQNALCKETAKITLGTNLEFLWNKINSVYTERKFQKATDDIPLRYQADVFNTDVVNSEGVVIKRNNCEVPTIKLLHCAGDVVLDNNGDTLFKYKRGDVLKDINGLPIIDTLFGIKGFIDILMVQLEYVLLDDVRYNTYYKEITSIITNWINNDLHCINDVTLEHTKIFYKPRKSNVSVELTNENKLNNMVSPVVTIYMDKVVYSPDLSYADIVKKVGKIIHKYIEKKTVIIDDIKKDIIANVTSGIVGVKITGISANNDELLSFKESSNRLSMKKVLTSFGEVVYDINLKIESV